MKFKRTTASGSALLLLAVAGCGTGNDGASTSSSTSPATSKTPATTPPQIAAEKKVAFTVKANPAAGNTKCLPNCWLPTQVAPVTVPGESVVPGEVWPNQGDAIQVLCMILTPENVRDVNGKTSNAWYKILVPGQLVTDAAMRARVQHVPTLKGYAAYVSQLWVTGYPEGVAAPPCLEG